MTYLIALMSTLLGVFLVISSSATQQYGPPRATENHDGRIVDNVDDDYGIEADQGIVKDDRAITAEPQCGTSIRHHSKIVGGKQVDVKGKFPWMAYLLLGNKVNNGSWEYHACGGAIIGRRHILTAAHCVPQDFEKPGYSIVMVRLGESNMDDSQASSSRRDVAVSKIFVHEGYQYVNKMYAINDIAILQLKERIDWTDMIRPICLPTSASALNLGGRMATVAGWGRTSEGIQTTSQFLMELEAPIIEVSLCKYLYGEARNIPIIREQICADHPTGVKDICNGTLPLRFPINKEQICTGYLSGGKSPCHGDSGGPLMFRMDHSKPWTIIGIVSWGDPGCGRKFTPGVFTRVVSHNDWILSKMAIE